MKKLNLVFILGIASLCCAQINTSGGGTTPGSNCGDASHALGWNGAYTCQAITGSAAAGGSTTQLQYNNATALGGISQFTTNGTTTITGSATSVFDLHSAGVGGLLLPGALATGIVKVTTSTGALTILTAPAGTIVGTSDAQALTNKDLTGAGNTFPTFNQNTTGTASSATNFSGSLAGDVTGTQGVTVVAKINGNSVTTGAANNQALICTSANTCVWKTLPDCVGSSNALNFTQATNVFSCLSITTLSNPMTTLGDIIYGGASGAVTRLAGPTATNSVPQFLQTTPSGGAAVAPVWAPAGVPTNAQTGTTYTVAATDRASYLTFSNASPIAVTLPQAGGTGFASNFVTVACDIGAGTATITPTTSTISYTTGAGYTSGAATMTLATGQCAWIYSDNANYFAIQRAGSAGGVTSFSGDTVVLSNSGSTGSVTATLANAAVGTVLGNATNASAAPTYHTLSAINPQTTTYQVLAVDFAAYKTISVASGTFTITLVASGSQPTAGQYINILNYGSGVVTVARSGQNINGAAANFTLGAGSASAPTSAQIWSDGTNYFAAVDEGTVGTVTSVATSGPITGGTITGSGTIGCATCNTTAAVANPPLDKSGTGLSNPTADATFTQPIGSTTGITLNGTAPASVATATGTNGSSILVVTAPVGGADSNATGTAGIGGSPAITAGAGGAGTGTNAVGGAGGSVTLTAGNGGASLGTGVNANGGNVVVIPGTAGSGGSGTAGKTGTFQVGSSAPAPIVGTAGGMIAVEGTAFTGISGDDGWYPNSTNHCFDLVNQTTDVGCAVAVGQANTYGNFLQDFSGGTIRVPTSVAGVTNVAGTFQAGADATTTGATAAITLRGEDVTGGSTASIGGGAATLRGGDTASTGNSNAGGAVTVRGGDATGGTGTTDTGGTLTGRGGNCTSTTGSCTPGAASVTAGGFTAAFTNGAASDTTIAAGLGTGNAAVSHVKIQSPALGLASGTTAESQITRWVNHTKAGSTTSATATSLFNIASATNTAWGVEITVHVDLVSSTPNVCGTTETFSLTGTNNNGTFGTVNVVAGTLSTLCSAGTLTLAVTATAANPSVISVTPTWATITAITSATITVQIRNVSQQEITLL